ncbi:glycosyltransferase family 4 protein [Streptococcus suis]|uniref:Glycosyltransferase n=1 Tax=Streptococcus suis TaxID=1307 RepID=A0A1P8VRF6_STRSU|nr:glycosyltransferase [Streptococcus suis]APZ79204.1 Glycosyltransferase [Streptococcus suis]MBY4966241.1 glycosyltransferase [Streptococcus suis]TII02096.1 glycosyltransferase family 4 protein [Streptococcus suis]HEM2769087.1 glycosyltransferase [Streptococcus suis]
MDKKKRKKISFFIGGMTRGGAERVISILANHYSELGWDVDIVLLLQDNVDYELNDTINIVNMVRKGNYVKVAPKWLLDIRKYLKKRKPDRIVSFVGRINILVLTAKFGLKIKTIISERNDPKHDGRGKLITAYGNLIYRTADYIVYQTQYEKSCFPNYLDKQGVVIVNPIVVSTRAHDNQRYHIVTAGRLSPQKNQAMLIKVVALLKAKFPELRLTIYGDGPLKATLAEQAKELGVAESIEFPGNVLNLHEQIATADIFVLVSEYEGLSNALLEAMMMGLPCITTDYFGADEVIKDGYNGLVISRNDVQSLYLALKKLLTNSCLRDTILKNSKIESKKYMSEEVLKEWDRVIL